MQTKSESYEIRAPFSGTIRSIKIKVGDIIGTEAADTEKNILLENSDLINVKLAINQLDITKVHIGQDANITFEAVPDALLVGKITEISSTPTADPNGGNATTYEVIISATKGAYNIYSGMNANVQISLSNRTDVLMVPLTAISNDKETGEVYVTVVDASGKKTKTKVITGETSGDQIEITD